MNRTNSLPRMNFKSNLANMNKDTVETKREAETTANIEAAAIKEKIEKRMSIRILTQEQIEDLAKEKLIANKTNGMKQDTSTNKSKRKPNLSIDLEAENTTSNEVKLINTNQEDINEIFDKEYEDKIEADLNQVWEAAEQKMNIEIEAIESEIEKFIEATANEKITTTLEINAKFDVELRSLEEDLDLTDETNINTIIYKQVKQERDDELAEAIEKIEANKKQGLADLKAKSQIIRKNYDKTGDINKIKDKISQNIKNKIMKSLTPKDAQNKRFEFPKMSENFPTTTKNNLNRINFKNLDCYDSNSSAEEENDIINTESININKSLKRNDTANKKISIASKNPAEKRVSRGYIGTMNFNNN